ncbi:MAG: Anthranilate synthase component II [Ignavibacteria bacterium]|nr:MAG: Anthranilate synthase component II [Ignavibacteria bacterium]KAF0161973.1 MAG: Anthranilate synthase component II [Ignavibacteria bacterium]
MKILVIDNYDSFTYNLVQLIGNFTDDIIVKRNDKISVSEIIQLIPNKIVISPGPGTPEDSGISQEVIKQLGSTIPILGVCLGHQTIGHCFNAVVTNAPYLMHGKTSSIKHDGKTIYKNVEQNFSAGRYHSLIIAKDSIPETLEITAQTEDEIIMGIRHKIFPLEGIQFHPESILTKAGLQLIKNWLEL